MEINRLEDLANRLLMLPNIIYDMQSEILNLDCLISASKEVLEQKESKIKEEISSAVNDDGKKLYTNDESRKAQFIKISLNDADYTTAKEILDNYERTMANKKIEIEKHYSEQKNIKTLLYFYGSLKSSELE